MQFKWLSRSLGTLAGLSLMFAAPASARETGGHPAMWKLADSDTTIYLFGTFHLLPDGQSWRTPEFDKALASAGELVLEVANIDDVQAVQQASAKLALGQGLPPLAERVPEEKRAQLAALMKDAGIPPQALDPLKTWMAAVALASISFQRLGLQSTNGVEMTLTGPFRSSGKPVKGLETIEEQFGFFDHLSEESQRKFLVGVLESPEDMKKELAAMLEAWSKGDLPGIARTFDEEMKATPELQSVLMAQRNARWAEWIKNRMEQPGTVFVAVGAGHLAGKDSVENMLAAKGLKAERVQ